MRKKYSAEFKSKVVLEALRERSTLSELSTRYGVHRMLIQGWKKQALKRMPENFASKKDRKTLEEKDKKIDKLYQEIGKLQFEKEWLKKKCESFND